MALMLDLTLISKSKQEYGLSLLQCQSKKSSGISLLFSFQFHSIHFIVVFISISFHPWHLSYLSSNFCCYLYNFYSFLLKLVWSADSSLCPCRSGQYAIRLWHRTTWNNGHRISYSFVALHVCPVLPRTSSVNIFQIVPQYLVVLFASGCFNIILVSKFSRFIFQFQPLKKKKKKRTTQNVIIEFLS